MTKINSIKTLECAGKYKNGGRFNLKIKSAAPRHYELNCVSFHKDGKALGAFGESFNDGSVNGFAEWSKNFMNKLQKYSDDKNVIDKVSEFFTSISK